MTEYRDGALLARATLAAALTNQLASAPTPGNKIQVGLSFKDKTGNYCRTFAIDQSRSLTGLACHERNQWQVVTLVGTQHTAGSAQGMPMAASGLSPVLLQAIKEHISGEPLDAPAETKARSNYWH